jgi:hypothetical protein
LWDVRIETSSDIGGTRFKLRDKGKSFWNREKEAVAITDSKEDSWQKARMETGL